MRVSDFFWFHADRKRHRPALAVLLLALSIGLTGCFSPPSRTRTAEQTQEVFAESDPSLLEDTGFYYYYSQLSTEDQQIYTQVYNGILAHEDSIRISACTADRFSFLLYAVLDDHPELFWVDNGYRFTSGASEYYYQPQYNHTEAETKTLQAQLDTAVQTAQAAIGQLATEYDTVKAAFEYICDHVRYEEGPNDQHPTSALLEGTSVCSGYSRALQYILQQYGISAAYVSGTDIAGDGLHAWLVVRVNGSYYNVDVTNGDLEDSCGGVFTYNYAFLCAPDEIYSRLFRTREDMLPPPACTSYEMYAPIREGAYFTSYDDAVSSLNAAFANGQTGWAGQFASEAVYQQFFADAKEHLFTDAMKASPSFSTYRTTIHYTHNDTMYLVGCWYLPDE